PTTAVYPLSLHDALPIFAERAGVGELAEVHRPRLGGHIDRAGEQDAVARHAGERMIDAGDLRVHRPEISAERILAKDRLDVVITDRKSTRLNSSHLVISY